MTGNWWSPEERDYTAPQPLAQFLAGGPPTVFIGFKSNQALGADFMLDTALRAGVRAVIQGA